MVTKKCQQCGNRLASSMSAAAKYCNSDCYHQSTRTYVTKKCPGCGKQFDAPRHKKQKYCTNACRLESKRDLVDHKCGGCGKLFGARPQSGRKFCSKSCASTDWDRPKSTCRECGKEFSPTIVSSSRYCSMECYNEFRANHKIARKCQECGKKFWRQSSGRMKYCSRRCSSLSRRRQVVVTCNSCGEVFTAKPFQNKNFCSRKCGAEGAGETRRGLKTNRPSSPPRGEESPCATVNNEQVVEAKKLLLGGKFPSEVAKTLAVSAGVIQKIARGQSWRHVGPEVALPSRQNRLSEIQISHVKWYLKCEIPATFIAKYFKVQPRIIHRIQRGLTHKHVKPKEGPPITHFSTRERPIRLRGERLKEKIREYAKPAETP